MRRSRKPFRAVSSDEGSNPSPSASLGRFSAWLSGISANRPAILHRRTADPVKAARHRAIVCAIAPDRTVLADLSVGNGQHPEPPREPAPRRGRGPAASAALPGAGRRSPTVLVHPHVSGAGMVSAGSQNNPQELPDAARGAGLAPRSTGRSPAGALRAPTSITLTEATQDWFERAAEGVIRTRSGDPYKPAALRA